MTFSAWWVEQNPDRSTHTRFRTDVDSSELPDGDVEIDVSHSGINYKDALALTGSPGVLRTWPIIPGIDLVGTVRSDRSGRFSPGDRVVLTGAGIGESQHGGLSERARVDAASLVAVPDRLSARDAATVGTAGVTALAAILEIERHGTAPGDGPVLVTGAAGGAGSIAIAALAARGWEVVASSGRASEQAEYLSALGASSIINRSELSEQGRPLQKERWAAVVDGVGGQTLVSALAQTRSDGIVTAYGMAQDTALPGSVLPFILRGVHLAGINSVTLSPDLRERIWARISTDVSAEVRELVRTVRPLAEAESVAQELRRGGVRGRTVIAIADGGSV
ncbi:MAG: acrylyl-CoA reductase family protein [Mycetocola sp.]